MAAVYHDEKYFNQKALNKVVDYIEPVAAVADGGAATDEFSLTRRLMQLSEREQLSEMDTWYCPKCKDHVQAFKKMDIWSVPDLMTLHLKRFIHEQSQSAYMGTRVIREKIETKVNFPMQFDMRPHVLGPQKDSPEPLLYQLYGVSNHMGGLGGGHYTAYARHGDEWFLFNDSTVSGNVTEADITSSDAYVLFYRRVYPEESSSPEAAEAGDGGGGGGGDDVETAAAEEQPAVATGAEEPKAAV